MSKRLSISKLQKSEWWAKLVPYFNLGMTNAHQLMYHYNNKINTIPLCTCGNPLGWHPDKRQYRQYCSVNCSTKGSRQQWQKHLLKGKLKIYDEQMSANMNTKVNGYYRLWDCGQYVYTLTK